MTPIDVEIEKLAEKYIYKTTIGKKFAVCMNGHIIWEGKEESAADAVVAICFRDDIKKFGRELIPLIREECAKIADIAYGDEWTAKSIAAAIREGK